MSENRNESYSLTLRRIEQNNMIMLRIIDWSSSGKTLRVDIIFLI